MPQDKYLSFEIDGIRVDVDTHNKVPTINYTVEDEDNFDQKTAATSYDIDLIPTLASQAALNTAGNPSVVDNTPDGTYDKPRPAKYLANGNELLTGQFFTQSITSKNGQVQKFTGKIYGLNGDWVILIKDYTLLDFVNPRNHTYTKTLIQQSWNYDGRSEILDFVYAPVRYQNYFGDPPPNYVGSDPPAGYNPVPLDNNILLSQLKPSLSIYWLLWRGLKKFGYKLKSEFLDSDYFRRMVMPWTWGGFDFVDDTRWEPLKFLASELNAWRVEGSYTGYPDLSISTDPTLVPGTFDNSRINNTGGNFTYTGANSSLPFAMVWHYPATEPNSITNPNLGKVRASFSVQLNYGYKIQQNSDAEIRVRWYLNGVLKQEDVVLSENAPLGVAAGKTGADFPTLFFETDLNPGTDYIAARIYVHTFQSSVGFARINLQMEQFKIDFVKLTDGSDVNFTNYSKFKDYMWLDLLRGVVDCFDLQIGTDTVRKEVIIEPTHDYEVGGVKHRGFYNRLQLDWSHKLDISEESTVEIYQDYERRFVFQFKDDSADGGLKKVQDRNMVTIGKAHYVLPERYKLDSEKRLENRFFAPSMHYEHGAFKAITGIAPQLIAMIPENVANTSAEDAQNTFQPKIAYYKGNVSGVGGWSFEGTAYQTFPFLFSVNYKPGGEADPVLSYSDQKIGGVVAHGLLKKFFWQRMAIYRHGRRLSAAFRLNNHDVMKYPYRESIVLNGLEYLLTAINEYDPVSNESTKCTLWCFTPIIKKDADAVYPSLSYILNGTKPDIHDLFNLKYWPALLLNTDVPK